MSRSFRSVDEVLEALSGPVNLEWFDAFRFLTERPETSEAAIAALREALEQLGVEDAGCDPVTGEPRYDLAEVAAALGVAHADLTESMNAIGKPT